MINHISLYATPCRQNVSLVNTVLATITAKAFKDFADAIEAGATPKSVAQKALKNSWKVSVWYVIAWELQTSSGAECITTHCTVERLSPLTLTFLSTPLHHCPFPLPLSIDMAGDLQRQRLRSGDAEDAHRQGSVPHRLGS